MPGRKVSHCESRWAQLPDIVIRCNGTLQSGKRPTRAESMIIFFLVGASPVGFCDYSSTVRQVSI
jgi:hypothetical protein